MSIRRKIKKTISLCIVAMLILVLPEVKLHAYDGTEVNIEGEGESASNMDENGGEETMPVEEAGENPDADQQAAEDTGVNNNILESSAVEYIYIDAAEIKYSETQNIVVALTDTGVLIHEAQIELLAGATGETVTLSASKIVDNTCLFEGTFDQNSLGEISLQGFRYKSDDSGIWNQVELSDVQKTSFAVIEETNDINTYSNEITPEITAYAFDESGEIKEATGDSAADVVEEVMEAANLETVAVPSARSRSPESRSGELVIALDPGHDSHCGGASANGLTEHVLTLKIANYCKAELEQYTNVKILMTRTGAECPNPLLGDYDSPDDILQRVDKAKAQGADVIVSFHLNSSSSGGGANGAEIIYQNQSYDANISKESKELAQKIQDQLVNLGLRDRGIYSKDADTKGGYVPQKDENGLTEDYWTFHNEAKAVGMPAVLIEHAFLSGNSDSVRLKNESFLQELGIADATGIANKYGLTKEGQNTVPSISSMKFDNINGEEGNFDIVLSGIEGQNAIRSIQVPVWTEANGQDDIVWYPATKQADGSYKVSVKNSKHNNEYGVYIAHAYIITKTGTQILANNSSFLLTNEKPGAAVKIENTGNGKFDVLISDVTTPYGLRSVQVPVWSVENGQDDIVWYTAQKQENGIYKVSVDIANHGYSTGLYMAHVYLIESNGNYYLANAIETKIDLPEVNIKADDISDGAQERYLLKASNVGIYSNVRSVSFAVWSAENGQDDIIWYAATRPDTGVWQAEVEIANHKSTGIYIVHTYATLADGSMKLIGTTEFNVADKQQKVSVGKVEASSTGQGKFKIVISDVTGVNSIERVSCPVWSIENGQDDIIWYTMEKQSDSSYAVNIDIANHNYTTGIYSAHIYVLHKNGEMTLETATATEVTLPEVNIIAKNDVDNLNVFQVSASNLGYYANINNVQFAIWSAENGQDDIVWYSAQQDSTGVYKTSVDASKHHSTGTFWVHAYATLSNGSQKLVGTTEFNVKGVEKPSAEKIEFDVSKYSSQGIFEITVRGVKASAGIQRVSVPVWSEVDGQDDIIWYDAKNAGNGAYKVSVNVKDHKYSTGIYNVHVYLYDNAGNVVLATADSVNLKVPEVMIIPQAQNAEKDIYEISASNMGFYDSVKGVGFAVWSLADGQNDLIWYTGVQDSATGVWKTVVDINKHDVSGTYVCHVYATLADGTQKFVGSTEFEGVKAYKIMGAGEAAETQMVSIYKKRNADYPSEALGKGGAPTIEEFCRILVEEAAIEGVKSEVVFAQAMLETNYLRFGGDVKIEQFNFAGLGATGNGAPGNAFENVRIGLRAQIQHLKCYASTEPLVQECVDQRWSNSLRGQASSVEALSGKWATNKEYGNNIIRIINEIKAM